MFWSWLRGFKFRDEVIIRSDDRRVVLPEVGEVEVSIEVNCLNASCPRPQILAMKAFNQLTPGEVMELISDNASSVESLVALAMVLNAHHLATLRDAQGWRVYMKKESELTQMREAG